MADLLILDCRFLHSLIEKKNYELSSKDEAIAHKKKAILHIEYTIKEKADGITSLQSKRSIDANEKVTKAHTHAHALEKQSLISSSLIASDSGGKIGSLVKRRSNRKLNMALWLLIRLLNKERLYVAGLDTWVKTYDIHKFLKLKGIKFWLPNAEVEGVPTISVLAKVYRTLSRSSYARVMIELRADVELKDNIVVAMHRIKGGHYICVGEEKTLKKPSQTSRGVPVGPKMSFKPQKEYRLVPKKHTASSNGNKKKGVVPTNEVSNSNPFKVLNSVDNDVELGNLVNNGATSSGSSYMNVDNSSTNTTPIIDKIEKFEELLTSGKATLVDEAGNLLKKVEFPDDYDSEDEVSSVDNAMARFMASERVGFGTESLLEQWRDSYGNGDYDEDPYDDDMYKGQDLPQELQAICDNLDIRVREGEPKLLDTTVGRVVPLLPIAPARASSELEESVEKLFDVGGSVSRTERGYSVSGGHGVDILQVSATADIVAEDTAPRLLTRAVLNPEVGVAALPTLPFITFFVSVTPEREDGNQSDFMAGNNLRTITAPPRFIISSDSSHHSGANIAEAEVDSFARPSIPLMTMATTVTSTADLTTTTRERFVEPSIFSGVSSSRAEHTVGGFSGVTGSDFIVGGIRTVVSPDTDLQKVCVPQWSVTNGSRLDDGRTCREMVDEFAPPKFFASIRGMKHDQLFTKFNVGAACQMSLKRFVAEARDEEIRETEAAEAIHLRAEASKFEVVEKSLQDEIKSLKECNTALEEEKGVLDVKVADLAATVKVREKEAADLDAMVTTVKLQNDKLADQVRELETSSAELQEKVTVYENCMSQLKKFQDKQMVVVHEKFNKLDADFIETCLHLEEKLYPHLLTTIAGRRWLLTYGMKLAVFKCLNSPEYLSALMAAISKAIEKGMQDGLVFGITHGQEGRVLADIDAFNPLTEDDFTSALQEVQNVNFSLLAKLQSNKDASVETVMDLLRLDEALAERLGLNDSQPHVDQLMVRVHHSLDQTVIGARALSLSLDVSHGRVQSIRENIANNRSALCAFFVSFSEPLSAAALEGTAGTSSVAPDITTPLSVTLASASTIPPISMDDYEIAHAEDHRNAGADVDPFPNIDEVELIIS
ncbi:hypothetical protein Tco_1344848 [Tanacetum coccineum]